jgi:hypothetical protein
MTAVEAAKPWPLGTSSGEKFRLDPALWPAVWDTRANTSVFPPTGVKPSISHKVPLEVATKAIHTVFGTTPQMGTDPEFFLARKNEPVGAFEVLKSKAERSEALPWFWDGFQAEVNAPSYACHQLIAFYLGKQFQLLPKGLQVVPRTTWRIPDDMLAYAAEAHVALGCEPSENAYDMSGIKVENPRELKWRFAGGHLHFSLEAPETDPMNLRYIVKTLDRFLGVPSVCLAQNLDHFVRRKYYGLAGEYRKPKHGLEYRTLSNFWTFHPQSTQLILDLARHACNLGRSHLRRVWIGDDTMVRNVINYSDVAGAKDLMKLNREFFDLWAKMAYGTSRPFWEAINKGVDRVVPNFGKDIVGVWSKEYANCEEVPMWASLR